MVTPRRTIRGCPDESRSRGSIRGEPTQPRLTLLSLVFSATGPELTARASHSIAASLPLDLLLALSGSKVAVAATLHASREWLFARGGSPWTHTALALASGGALLTLWERSWEASRTPRRKQVSSARPFSCLSLPRPPLARDERRFPLRTDARGRSALPFLSRTMHPLPTYGSQQRGTRYPKRKDVRVRASN